MLSELPPPEPVQIQPPPPGTVMSEPAAPDPQERVWGFWPTLGLGAAVFAIYALAQSLVALAFAIPYVLDLAENPELNPQTMVRELTTNGLMISIATIVSAIAGVGFIILFVKIRKGITLREYMALNPVGKKTLLIIIAVLAALLAVSTLFDHFNPQSQNTNFTVDLYRSAGWTPLLWIAVVIFAPVFEESFFRGFVFAGLKRSFLGPGWTIFLTALVFASLHALQYDAYGVATVFVLGLFLGAVRQVTGSLWSTILLHATWNLAGMITTAISLR